MDQPTPITAACDAHSPRSGKAALCARCGDEQARRQEDRVRKVEELSSVGMEMTRAVAREAVKYPAPQWSEAYSVMSRSIRLSVALEARLDAGWPWHRPDAALQERRQAAQDDEMRRRKAAVRAGVEGRIERDAEHGDRESLTAELNERLEDPSIEDELGNRSVHEIIDDICRGLNIAPDLSVFEDEAPEGEPTGEPETVAPAMADDAAAVPARAPAADASDGVASDPITDDATRTHRRFSQEI
jgi:hypothetical protein